MSWESRWYGRTSVLATLVLAPLSWCYGLAVALRSALFKLGLMRETRLEGATVVSVGNVVVGGSGKTPVTIFLAQWAQACGRKVAVLSRGYGRASAEVLSFSSETLPPVEQAGDEPRLIARRCPGVTVWVGADRVVTGRRAIAAGSDFLILDDGYQHRRLHRDVNLLVESDVGNGHLLPWGPLREPVAAASRATHVLRADARRMAVQHVLVPSSSGGTSSGGTSSVTGSTALDASALRASGKPVRPSTPLRDEGAVARKSPQVLRSLRVVLLTGIARPARVRETITGLGARVVAEHAFPDHHQFTAAELAAAQADARDRDAVLVTTEKDAERLPPGAAWVLQLSLEIASGVVAELAASLGLDPARVPLVGPADE